jgi:hypothetical protein
MKILVLLFRLYFLSILDIDFYIFIHLFYNASYVLVRTIGLQIDRFDFIFFYDNFVSDIVKGVISLTDIILLL